MKSYLIVILLLLCVSSTLVKSKTTKQPKSSTGNNKANNLQSSVFAQKNEKSVGKFRHNINHDSDIQNKSVRGDYDRIRMAELTKAFIMQNLWWHLGRDGVEKKMMDVVLSNVDMNAITQRSQRCMKNLTEKLKKYYKEASDEFIPKCLTIFPFCDENDQKSKKGTTFYFNVSNILAMRLNGDVTRIDTFKLYVKFRDIDKKKIQRHYRQPLYMVIYGTRKRGRNSTEPIKVLRKVKFNPVKQEWLKISLKKEMKIEKKKRSSDNKNNSHSYNNNLYRGIVLSVVDSKNEPIDIREIFYNHRCTPGNSLETRNSFSLPHLEVNVFSKRHSKTFVSALIMSANDKAGQRI